MAVDMLRAVTALLSTCSRRVSRAARRLRDVRLPRGHHLNLKTMLSSRRQIFSGRRVSIPFVGGDRRKKKIAEERHENLGDELGFDGVDEDEVWRRGIIMGEKCQPLDFSGAIYYDSDGRQLSGVPRSPMRSPLPAFLVNEKPWK